MMKQIKKIIMCLTVLSSICSVAFVSSLLAMDIDLWNVPQPPNSTVIWQDKPVEINHVKARATHLRSDLSFQEILNFYQDTLSKQGWKFSRNLTDIIFTFLKENRFMYVAIEDNGKDYPCDVYIVSSPTALTICHILKDYFLKEPIVDDAPGKDLPDIPRYPGSRRRLDIFAPSDEGVVLLYEAEGRPQEIAKFYRQDLRLSGWKEEEALTSQAIQKLTPQIKDSAVLLFYRGNDTLLINITRVPKDFPSEKKAQNRSFIIITKNISEALIYPEDEGVE